MIVPTSKFPSGKPDDGTKLRITIARYLKQVLFFGKHEGLNIGFG